MDAFRILLADEHPIFRLGLGSVLGSHENWEVCGEAGDGWEAVRKCMQLKPDLVILDICLPRSQRILILTDVDAEKLVRDCLQAGARGWVLKSDGIDDLTPAVEALRPHNWVLGVRTPPMLVGARCKGNPSPTAAKAPQLSPRQCEVLQLLAEGKRCKAVAVLLNITVKWQKHIGPISCRSLTFIRPRS